jgi:hypothetical protein
MSRRVRWILLALLVVVVGAVVALFVSQQPKLDDARSKVDAAWKPLRAPDQLPLRYQKLEGAVSAFDAAGGKGRGVSTDLHAAIDRWNRALRGDDAGAQVTAANELEAQGTRLVSNVNASERIKGVPAVIDALVAFTTTKPNPTRVLAYNQAARDYEDERSGALAQPVARILGFGARPVLALGAGAG